MGGGGALSSNVSKLGSKEVSKKLRNFSFAIKKACHCEDERSEDVAIAKSLNINEITTQSSIARNDTNRHPELVSGSKMHDMFDVRSRNCVRDDRYSFNFFNTCHRALIARSVSRLHKRVAFTLAEVLITLGIIGVVASLTIPTIVKTYKEKLLISQLKKAYATLANGLQLSAVDNGDMQEWPTGSQMNIDNYWKIYIQPYFNSAQICKNSTACGYKNLNESEWSGANWRLGTMDSRLLFRLIDGTVIFIPRNSTYANGAEQYVDLVFIDVNGTQKPNKYCSDVFVFQRNTKEGIRPTGCTKILIKNNWRF